VGIQPVSQSTLTEAQNSQKGILVLGELTQTVFRPLNIEKESLPQARKTSGPSAAEKKIIVNAQK